MITYCILWLQVVSHAPEEGDAEPSDGPVEHDEDVEECCRHPRRHVVRHVQDQVEHLGGSVGRVRFGYTPIDKRYVKNILVTETLLSVTLLLQAGQSARGLAYVDSKFEVPFS